MDAYRTQFLRCAPGFQNRRRFGIHDESEGALRWVTHHLDHLPKALFGDVISSRGIHGGKNFYVNLLAEAAGDADAAEFDDGGVLAGGDELRGAAGDVERQLERSGRVSPRQAR